MSEQKPLLPHKIEAMSTHVAGAVATVKPSVIVKHSDGSTQAIVDAVPHAHGLLNTLLQSGSASEALYKHLGHGRWTNFFLKTVKEALANSEGTPLTHDEEVAIDAAIARQKGMA